MFLLLYVSVYYVTVNDLLISFLIIFPCLFLSDVCQQTPNSTTCITERERVCVCVYMHACVRACMCNCELSFNPHVCLNITLRIIFQSTCICINITLRIIFQSLFYQSSDVCTFLSAVCPQATFLRGGRRGVGGGGDRGDTHNMTQAAKLCPDFFKSTTQPAGRSRPRE